MSGKPAARLGDPTACPIPGHGTNPIAAGSPDVLFDSLPAARMGDASACGGAMAGAVIPNVLINGKPAAVVGSVGSHGNVVIGGSGTVIIGASGGGAAVSPVAPLSLAGAAATVVNALVPPVQAAEQPGLDYSISLKRGGNRVLTPLMIPDYEELAQGTTKNQETIDFLIRNRRQEADRLTLEVFDGEALLYSETDTASLLPEGEHLWQWDGYSNTGVLDTKVLKSADLFIRLTAIRGSEQQVSEFKLTNKAQEVEWVDVRVDRSAGEVNVTVRPSFSDGGIEGSNSHITALSYQTLEHLAKAGIEFYWSRSGDRALGIGVPVNTSVGSYKVSVTADINIEPKAKNFPLVENLTNDGGRSTSFGVFRKIHHNLGYAYFKFVVESNTPSRWSDGQDFADGLFKETAAHEFGHLVLNEYGDGGLIPQYSWTHKSTSTLWQSEKPNNPMPVTGEIDIMHYHSTQVYWKDRFSRMVASENDVKGLVWLGRIKFND
ncbi:PAAR domain-containing protein [Ectopseudomonas guguanensis]|jgi:uncharacterized Zn-binding protein involved in type VI secretion|uniref:Zn-binding Pro-Ala-Ala-Arg (PAAR) domain-containing protein, incolved in TypeVI secretion n=1 Tax=Ectopseudomonas guguanensis TaxID=1198456 RepID=A0A1H0WWF8_9GAMM|nr:PAAR domain-containing protein [Pseudomonas guguanensis]SDP95078.1 Zn-binding Pro-Ala-Ala-Arg (PAAR) domain-containing protein, incolved in TypeVI secretion [Pseudomonas guguanensis]